MSATQIVALVTAGSVPASEITEAALAHIAATEPQTNAFIHVDPTLARRDAAAVDRLVRDGRDAGALAGVPVSVKDLVHVAGMPTSGGSRLYAGRLASEDAAPVARLRAAGAVVVGKTTTPEFGHKPVTNGALFGETLNPWNRAFTCGGSSGGAAVSLVTGQVPLAVGTDGGGSIRIPASVCGVYGLKATLGAIAHVHAPDLFGNSSYIGPMARSTEDLLLMFGVMAGGDRRDPWTRRQRHNRDKLSRDCTIGYATLVGNAALSTEIAGAIEASLNRLRELGFRLTAVDLALASYEPHFRAQLEGTLAGRFGALLDSADRGQLDESFIETLENGRRRSVAELVAANIARTELYHEIESVLSDVDFLITPTVATPSIPHDTDTHEDITIDGLNCGPIRAGWYPYTFPFNMTGHPALSMPIGVATSGIPIGLQIVGSWDDEVPMIELAALLEGRPDLL